jgi:hypothetical protein
LARSLKKEEFLMRFLLLFVLLIALLACSSLVPANAPLQLNATAGAPIVINDESVDAGLFTVDYPDGWRVVKLSLAGAPIELVFVSPDETMRIQLRQGKDNSVCAIPESTPEFGNYWPDACLYAGSTYLVVLGYAEREDRLIFDEIFAEVVDSIHFR